MPKGLNAHLKTAVKRSTLVLASTVASQLVWFCIKILVVRSTTKAEFGIYSLMLTIFGVLVTIVPLGVPAGVTRFVSLSQGEENRAEAVGISKAGVQIALCLGLAASIAIYFLSGQIARHVFYTPGLAGPLRIISFLLPFAIYQNITGGILLGNGFISQKIFNDLLTPVFYMLLILVVLLFHMHFSGILFAYVSASLAIVFLVLAFGFKKLGGAYLLPFARRGCTIPARPDYKKRHEALLKFSVPLLVASVTNMIIMWADTLMVGRYIGAKAVGTYSVSVSLVNLLLFPLTALSFVFLPISGEIYANDGAGNNGLRDLKRAYQVLTKWAFAATLPIFFVLFFFPQMTITALFGPRFLDAALPLRFLAFGLMINAFLGTNGMLMMVMGYSREIMNISVAGAAFNIAMNYILIKKAGLGLAGASISTMSSYILINVLYSLSLYRRSGLHPFSPSYMKPLAGAAISGLLIYAVAKSLPLSFWMLPVYFLLFVGGYGASLLLTRSIEAEDLFILERVLNRMGVQPEPVLAFFERFTRGGSKPTPE